MRSILLASLSACGVLKASPQNEITEKAPKALEILDRWQKQEPVPCSKKVHIIYWTPSDREPAARYDARLGAIFGDIQDFYRKEMIRIGFGPRTFELGRDEQGAVKIHLVRGKNPYENYSRKSGGIIVDECRPTLKASGIDPASETFVVFCNMSNWDPEARIITQNSPYYASGTNCNGTAWQVDSPILDLDLLSEKEQVVKDGEYGRITLGKYNSIFIGGAAHELGHALGLPHCCERDDEAAAFGTALMGSGNRSYGDERRGEGKGAFLSLAHALKLASHPLFSGSMKGIETKSNAIPTNIAFRSQGQSFTCSGRVIAEPPVYAVLGYMDPVGGGDYDARTCTAVPDAEGRFDLNANGLVPGKAGIFRLVFLQANGAATSFATPGNRFNFPYQVSKEGKVDLAPAEAKALLPPLLNALDKRSIQGAKTELGRIRRARPTPPIVEVAETLARSTFSRPTSSPSREKGNLCYLSNAETTSAKIGYGPMKTNRPPQTDGLFILGGELFPRGINAHAPSEICWDLAGKWKVLAGSAGFPDSATGGSCEFSVLGDGKTLWTLVKATPGKIGRFELNVSGVKELKLVVGDGGDGNSSDWSCWFDPILSR